MQFYQPSVLSNEKLKRYRNNATIEKRIRYLLKKSTNENILGVAASVNRNERERFHDF